MKRGAIAFGSFIIGILFTWTCLYVFSDIDFPQQTDSSSGCEQLGTCDDMSWQHLSVLAVLLLGPAVLFAGLNAIAWQRWPVRRWRWSCVTLALATCGFYASGYVSW